jgi:hypothetical protein
MGWLVGRSVGWSVGWLVGQSVGWRCRRRGVGQTGASASADHVLVYVSVCVGEFECMFAVFSLAGRRGTSMAN